MVNMVHSARLSPRPNFYNLTLPLTLSLTLSLTHSLFRNPLSSPHNNDNSFFAFRKRAKGGDGPCSPREERSHLDLETAKHSSAATLDKPSRPRIILVRLSPIFTPKPPTAHSPAKSQGSGEARIPGSFEGRNSMKDTVWKQESIFNALHPSKSGLIHKHVVEKHIGDQDPSIMSAQHKIRTGTHQGECIRPHLPVCQRQSNRLEIIPTGSNILELLRGQATC
jgi:hypothetical protein